jgi:ketosteroid isomerase-like protein
MKKLNYWQFILLCIVFVPIICCKQHGSETAMLELERQHVKTTIDNVMAWAIKKDFKLFYSSIANDSNFISVTPYNRVKFGFETVRKDSAFWGSPHFKAIRHELRDWQINFSQSGDIAWFFCYLDDINEWKGQPANWENARWTGVLEKQNGKWRIVQQHFSFASE